ncbi:hypothetical protein CFE70_000892 [Pyrenophora teres f. teres 0-1]|uniref:IgE-binding protein n=3 Tax=cellular organisms TaxID=131567 RepID=E3RYP4_PYRTT|nr:hypothetical protein PTT_14685 [Pyrenophora teres f. teres 0-1]KAE8824430.1 hypothetical protein HRS9122_10364 [Pyrenophora teres f. teres]KAE8863030.1 hypothetical protein PTNB29_05592 [Pyrenophora teres f. teres]CAE6999900.1 hypothetical protein PTTW11_00970 [Pyrenophora teres f. teres]
MQYTLAFITLVAGVMAGSACRPSGSTPSPSAPAPVQTGHFTVVSARSGSPIHYLTLTARSGQLYLGGPGPTTSCPAESIGAENCPPGNTTVLSGGTNTLGLGVVVPGGQQIYVQKDGLLGYTQPHSAAIPDGASQVGWSREAPTGKNAFGYLHHEGGLFGCPAGEGFGYRVYAQVPDVKFGEDCLGFDALTVEVSAAGAWQYTK